MSTQPFWDAKEGIDLSDVLPDAQPINATRLKFRSACGKWSDCQPGDLYVAISEADFDGHEYAANAIQRGSIGVVTERLLAIKAPQFIVEDSRVAYGEICNALSGSPSKRMNTIGVTGTAGKTVTAHLIRSMLNHAGQTVGLSSSIETCFGDTIDGPVDHPTPPELASQLAKMVIGKCKSSVIELSGVQLARQQLAGIQLDGAVITNVLPTNLELHGSFENYQNALFRSFENVKPAGFAIVNADDPKAMELLNMAELPALTYGIHQPAEITAKLLDRNRCFQTFLLTTGNESTVVRTSTIGKQHLYNCLAAAATGLMLGISMESIVTGIETTSLPGRLERVDYGQDFGIWIDSGSTPTQLNSAIAAVSQVCEGKIWCIGSTASSQTISDRRRLGSILERKTEKPIVTQAYASDKIDYEPCHQVLDGFEDPAKAHVMPDRVKAIQWALANAKPQDIVLITGAGEKKIARRGELENSITDRDVCSSCLASKPVHSIDNWNSNNDFFRIDDYR